jgi:redox-sensing transcriptional repressor
MPMYLNYLKALPIGKSAHISATIIADGLGLNDVQVRKDLAMVGLGGRPKVGYAVKDLISDIEHCLGYDNTDSVVLIGLGNVGRALLTYDGFSKYGLDIVAVFDADDSLADTTIYGKQVLPVNKLQAICTRMKVKIGIITPDAKEAQDLCDILVKSGVIAIWNFTSVRLCVPEGVLVKNENMESSLAVLSNHLVEKVRTLLI